MCDGSHFRYEIRDWPPQPTQLAEKFVEIVVASCGKKPAQQPHARVGGLSPQCKVGVNLEITASMLAATTKYPLLTLLACNVVTRKKS